MRRLKILLVGISLIATTFFAVSQVRKIHGDGRSVFSSTKATSLKVASFVSPHHLVAEKIIEDIFSKVADKNKDSSIERVILVSPNHFNLGTGWAITSNADWQTNQGVVLGDKDFVNALSKTGLVHLEDKAFQKEHGIENLLPYVKKYFPQALVAPLMVRDEFPEEKVGELAEILAKNSDEKTLFILSADFSHYLEKNISQLHNEKSIDVLSALDFKQASRLDIDCVPGLQLLMKFSDIMGYENFTPKKSSNSSEILGKNFLGENTSYVTGYYEKGQKKALENLSLMFFGDLMLDRDVRTLMERKSPNFITEKIQRLFWSQDLNVANLEGPITQNTSVSVGTKVEEKNHLIFTFDPKESIQFIAHTGIDIVSIGNNHILNFKKEGLENTERVLTENNIGYFGSPVDGNSYLIKNINNKKVAFVDYNQFSNINSQATADIIREVKNKSDLVVVYAHWGTEYELNKIESQKERAHQFIDAGADIIIGSHPHVVEPLEIYKNKIIFYSLGNFVFDQYFSEDTKTMLAAGISIQNDLQKIVLEPLYQERTGQIVLAPEEKRNALLERLANDSEVDYNMKQGIRAGYITIKQ